jgi:Tol biopolymer transport system component
MRCTEIDMAIEAGTHFASYEILGPLGAGGMGEVYRAHDPRIGRDVAIKVLRAATATDTDRLHRFQQEAHAAGILNHPNLLTIYELGTSDGAPYIVSELLEGETLRERMNGSALAPRRALDYALQIANGLAAAHEKGIVHRDLKPENIFVCRDGRVKILDFGLAKLRPASVSEYSDVATVKRDTDPGTVLGTAGYMSPEQVRGEAVDHRSDIFSFGAILYEMLSGRRAFKRDSSIETLNAILKEDPPDLLETSVHIPPALDRVVRHCLEKHPEARFQSSRDVAFDIEAISELSGSSSAIRARGARRSRRAIALTAFVVAAAIAAATAYFAGIARHRSNVPSFQRITFRRGQVSAGRFAPDGQTIAYSAQFVPARSEIFAARTDSPESRPLGIGEARLLSVSRSGEMAVLLNPRVLGGFMFSGTLARAPLGGGAAREIANDVEFADWDPEGKNLAIARTVAGKDRIEFPLGHTIYETAGWVSHLRVSPRGDAIAFIDHPARQDDGGAAAVIDLDGKKKKLTPDYVSAQGLAWSPDGQSIWFTATKSGISRILYSVSLSGALRSVYAAPGPLILQDIAPDGRVLLTEHSMRLGISAFVPGTTQERDLSWLDWSLIRDLSSDGKLLLFDETGEAGGSTYSVYFRKTDGSPAIRLGEGSAMAISPDGRWALVIHRSAGQGQLAVYPIGAGEPRDVTHDAINHQWASWFPDGKRILFFGNEPGQPLRLYVQDLDGGTPKPIAPPGVSAYANAVSPDEKYLVVSTPDRRVAIYPLDGGSPRLLPESLSGAVPCQWSSDGSSIYLFRRGEIPARLTRFDLRNGRETLVRELPRGELGVTAVRVTPDGRYYAYSVFTDESQLYLMQGANKP